MTQPEYGALVIGGGFYGCSLALHLRRYTDGVLVLEKEPDLLGRASYANQARVHNGYHYPRSLLTALRSRANFPRFVEQYRDCIDGTADHYYAVCKSTAMSKVSAAQFKTFCERIGAPLSDAPVPVRALFNPALVGQVFSVREALFDAARLRRRMADDLRRAGVDLRVQAEVVRIDVRDATGLRVTYRSADGEECCTVGRVFNCTYSRINHVLAAAGLPAVPLKHEVTEIALVEVPAHLRGMAITIVDGPYWSTMPFPPRRVHSLTHVRYTPHCEWHDSGTTPMEPHALLAGTSRRTSFAHMIKDAQRYIPSMAGSRYVDSIWEVKTVLPQSEVDDSRPILFHRSPGMPNLISIMGGKIDNIYDVLHEVDQVFA
jgi:glycine/D-amino acid oxidase-like deaminating enzyme